jgi:chromosome segregation ATPase
MSTNLNQAADSINRLALLYQDMVVAAAALTALGSLEQATGEAQARLDSVRADGDTAVAALAVATQKVVDAHTAADSILADARSVAATATAAANEEAARVTQAAKDAADKVIADATAAATELTQGAQARTDSELERLTELQAQSNTLAAQIVAANAELATVQDNIAKAKDGLRNLLA